MKGVYGVAICAAFVCAGACAAPGVLKDTLACLEDDYKDFSLMHGGMASETRVIERMYDYGALGKRGDKIESKNIALVHKLFHRPSGSSGPAGFLVTKPLRELSNTKVAEFVASELVFFKRLPYEECFKQYQVKYKEFRSALVGGVGDKKIKQFEKALGQARRGLLTAFDTAPDHPSFESPLKELAHCPIKAFIECMDNEYMPATMPQIILQALLYKKTEGESTASRRAAFRTYYEWLDKRLDCLAYPLPATWEQDLFSSDQREQLLAETKTLPAAQAYERWVFLNLSPTDYPRLLSYGDVTIQGAAFTDCMENTVRNLSNFLAYNPQTGLFDTALLERRLGTHVHESMKRFYEQFGDPAIADQRSAHNAWAEITSTLPNHVYCRALPPISHQKKDCVKIVPETPVTTEFLAKKGYVSLPENSLAYDMRPLIKNFMLTCDYLFGLQVFKTIPADAWAQEGFIATHLPRVIEAMKARVPTPFDSTVLEQLDGMRTHQYVPLSFSFSSTESKPYDFAVTLHIEHTAEYSEGELLFNQPPTTTIALPSCVKIRSEAQIFMESANAVQKQNSEGVLAWLFAQDLSDNVQRYALMQQVPIFNERILEVLLFSARKHAVGDEQTLHVLRIYQEALSRGLAGNKQIVDDACARASEAVHAKNMLVRGQALQLFNVLFAHNKGVEEATTCAESYMRSSDKKDVSAGVALFKKLVEWGKSRESARKAAYSVLQDTESGHMGSRPTGLRFEVRQFSTQLLQEHGATEVNGVLRRKRKTEDNSVYEQLQGELAKKKLKVLTQEWAALVGMAATSVDTAVRTLLNTLSYNPDTKRFDSALLEQRLGVQVRQELKHFYAENNDPAFTSTPSVATSWEQLVSCNIPFVVYDCAYINGLLEQLPVGARGFIKGVDDPAVVAALVEKGYVLVDDDTDVFGVKSSLKNLIVMFDYLLNLKLFNGDLEHEFLRENFVAIYVPKLATALHTAVVVRDGCRQKSDYAKVGELE